MVKELGMLMHTELLSGGRHAGARRRTNWESGARNALQLDPNLSLEARVAPERDVLIQLQCKIRLILISNEYYHNSSKINYIVKHYIKFLK